MTDARRLAEFIAEQLGRQDVPARLARLVCVQIVNGNRIGDEIRMVSVPDAGGDVVDEEWIAATAKKLVDAALDEAVTLGSGVQRYAVQARFGAEERSRARFVFTCQGADDGDEFIGTEGPDAEGLTAQAMRHTEFFAQLAGRDRALQMKELRDEIASLRKENGDLRAEQMKAWKMLRELYLEDATRQTESRREAVKTRLIEGSVEKLELYVPHALNAWSRAKGGKDIFPEAATQMVAAKTFADSVTDADLEAISRAVGPEKASNLIQFMLAISKMQTPAAPTGLATTPAPDKHGSNGVAG